jgi:hypothetical protein
MIMPPPASASNLDRNFSPGSQQRSVGSTEHVRTADKAGAENTSQKNNPSTNDEARGKAPFGLRRDEAIAKGVTINGLVIPTETPGLNSHHTNPLGGLANYYRNNVIGRPGVFVMVAANFNSFRDVLVKKLINEIAQADPRQRASN